ncbi:MAG: presqualene diphosphate synthase HpnD [Alphaproteobacteria bacterium]|nr:presqualene diphosphate synthase HpnD [Alphaproteobacteria bacterium]MDE1986780.1 presqualene diphosphate synthase HpnD [Alphaproteobacteria bacterium]MDE2162464.1 presqualene diphosphate synthase HpnD [Alphaproteobacteria bacterium]MDE2266138.1 presqualene diphosphate synthase HpnD [Alphaproteobacteria bacterium]MDE2499181.1 presqualene diphosphate synthase HpnD [Alphaproteobacteria bacterium]
MTNPSISSAPEIEAVRRKAAGSSFYSAMRLMPKAEREGMYAIYAFCRAVDDIADDGVGSREERHAALDQWREDVMRLCTGGPAGRGEFLTDVVAHYHPRVEDFLAVIDGMDMDVAEDIVAPDLATLDLYCDRVASAVGRLSIKVFGMAEEPGFALAHHLGRALQLTNILRDLDEDAAIHRLYLPREYLMEAGLGIGEPREALANPAIDSACRKVAVLAHRHYEEAHRVLRAKPKGNVRAPRLMAAVYSEILRRMEAVGWAPPRARVRLPKTQLAMIVLRHGFGA